MVSISAFLQSLLVIILIVPAYVLYMGYKMGEFDEFESTNIENCRRIKNDKPCEDATTLSDGTFIFGCDFIKEYIHYGAIYSELSWKERAKEVTEKKGFGEMKRLNKEQNRLEKIPIRGYKGPDFHPHGIYAVKNQSPDQGEWVFVVNHQRDGEVISIFKVVTLDASKTLALDYIGSVTNDQWTYLNDLAVIPDSQGVFYVSNWFENDPGSLKGAQEIMLKSKWSHLLVCGEKTKPLSLEQTITKTDTEDKHANSLIHKIDCRRVGESIAGANGVSLSNDKRNVFVVSPGTSEIFVYDRNTNTNDLKERNRIHTRAPCDNINIDIETGDLYASCYPKPLSFLWAGWKYPKAKAHTRLIRIPNGFKDSYQVIMQSNGELISTSSACAHYRNTLVASSLHDPAIAVCHDL